MDKNIKIAGELTIGDWLRLKVSLESDLGKDTLWCEAYDFFEKRICTRYLKPIEAIEKYSDVEGEGFAITTIICSLIEALESFRLGKVYKRASKGNPLDETKEYFKSQPIFEDFLKNHEPFSAHFAVDGLANNFYENVRCAVLHEAATRSGWKIRIDTTVLVEKHNESLILNRALFVDAIKQYMCSYKAELLRSNELKQAFIKKLDSICETA
ncbi:MAG: hypothetical protein A3E57_00895 [Candidatus Muproteobacteria bacterium RIFCSPHIGHO2_12_FULL_60_33]|uniref:Uncharacterized protein n=1 Tax=Candidatus Muproteobacteria bacterium RIFCSPLOWO2_01_FULL_60_18 TaxID=1817768 RepID=A0A1F6U1T8_9PROT|nr:MAG: hypothetical protein A3A87_04570 [Candidatus Muproteobacteria bacterium RIFCSPLOWO2_01_FULL_60_18]OGI53419.1 MAG: hypothetical protein A2W42_02900 [Candidatus Muproteobacteria bacterium RIFCSPHIGHO2_01_60_12]OGI55586.1 MAG: hypothetical protein A3E57_00895 [Candidatus Muproteobacteria bacterium RIFCSPHIGHO2_12_FULL_60_33]OGI56810.1 MAG: hypothetical protein A3D32_04105 [Candidatus Muproteobacteria bacterium RIFCSPHIGHO2_02_FULL_60_13]